MMTLPSLFLSLFLMLSPVMVDLDLLGGSQVGIAWAEEDEGGGSEPGSNEQGPGSDGGEPGEDGDVDDGSDDDEGHGDEGEDQ